MTKRFLAATLVGLAVLTPARAADPATYVQDEASMYVHISVRQLLSAPVVRKSLPLAFDKFGDKLLPLLQLAKTFNPNAPDIPEDDFKKILAELKKEETFTNAFDKAKDVVTDVVISGDADDDDGDKILIAIKGPDQITAEAIDGISGLIPAGQIKIKKHRKDKVTIFEMELPAPANEQAVFMAVPEPGIILIAMKKDPIEAASARAAEKKKAKLSAEMTKLLAQRKASDFLFAAAIKGDGDEREVVAGSLTLDKDVGGRLNATYATEAAAKKKAEEMKEGFDSGLEGLKSILGDNKDLLTPIIESFKAKVDGKTVRAEFSIPGKAIEKMLAKDS